MANNQNSTFSEGEVRCSMVTNEDARILRVKRLSNIFALFAVLDALITFPLVVYILRKGQFTELAAISSCIQIMCLLLMSIISACLLLQTKHKYYERIDAIGAWLFIHLLTTLSNLSIVVFELWPCLSNLWAISIPLTVLISWKAFFIVIEIFGLPYSFCVLRTAYRVVTCTHTPHHPLFNENSYENENNNNNRHRFGSNGIISGRSNASCPPVEHTPETSMCEELYGSQHRQYDSYMSLSRQYQPYDNATGPMPFHERYPRVLPSFPANLNDNNNNGVNRGYAHDGCVIGPSTIGTAF